MGRKFVALLFDSAVDFVQKRYTFLAAAVSFNTLLAVIPLLAVIASVASYVPFENINWARIIHAAIPSLLLNDQEIVSFLTVNRNAYGISGFAVAYMLSLGLFRALDQALYIVFERPPRKLKEYIRLQFVLFPFFILGMITAYIVTTSLTELLSQFLRMPFFAKPGLFYIISTIHSVTSLFGFMTIASFLFTLFHFLAPRRKKYYKYSAAIALFGACVMTALRKLFIVYFSLVSTAKNIYGTFSSVFGLLLWVLVGYAVILYCARVLYKAEKINGH